MEREMKKRRLKKIYIISILCLIFLMLAGYFILFNTNISWNKLFGLSKNQKVENITSSDKTIIEFGDSEEKYINFSINNVENNANISYYLDLSFITNKLSDTYKDKNVKLVLEKKNNDVYEKIAEKTLKLNEDVSAIESDQVIVDSGYNYYRVSFVSDENNLLTNNNDILGKLSLMTNMKFSFKYAENYQEFTPPINGEYYVELWGARGNYYAANEDVISGNGAYTAGKINMTTNEKYYIYTGKNSIDGTAWYESSFNGGESAKGISNRGAIHYSASGGGATDIRYYGSYTPTEEELNTWDNTLGLKSRIMVAAGGAGSLYSTDQEGQYDEDCSGIGGAAGGLYGYEGESIGVKKYNATLAVNNPKGGTQTSGGAQAECMSDDLFCNYSLLAKKTVLGGSYGKDETKASSMKGRFGKGGYPSGGGGYYGGSGAANIGLMTNQLSLSIFVKDENGESEYTSNKDLYDEIFDKMKENGFTDSDFEKIEEIVNKETITDEEKLFKKSFIAKFTEKYSMLKKYFSNTEVEQTHTSGAGGSSFISGHTGSVAITYTEDDSIVPKEGCVTGTTDNECSVHYSGKKFTDTSMIDGKGLSWTNIVESSPSKQMPNPSGGYFESGKGNQGSGAARITLLNADAEAYSTLEIKENSIEVEAPKKVIVNYYDEEGNKISETETITNADGKKEYVSEIKNIKGYAVKTIPENYKGKFINDEEIVNIIYRKDSSNTTVTENNGTQVVPTIVKNPSTGDKVMYYVVIGLLSLVITVIFVIKYRKL